MTCTLMTNEVAYYVQQAVLNLLLPRILQGWDVAIFDLFYGMMMLLAQYYRAGMNRVTFLKGMIDFCWFSHTLF